MHVLIFPRASILQRRIFSKSSFFFLLSLRGGDSHGHSAPQAPGLEGKIRAVPSEYIVIGLLASYYGIYKLATGGKKEAPAPAQGHWMRPTHDMNA